MLDVNTVGWCFAYHAFLASPMYVMFIRAGWEMKTVSFRGLLECT